MCVRIILIIFDWQTKRVKDAIDRRNHLCITAKPPLAEKLLNSEYIFRELRHFHLFSLGKLHDSKLQNLYGLSVLVLNIENLIIFLK